MKGEVMKTLIEWCSENGKIPYALGVKGAYEAGQESRQTELVELQKRVDKALFDMNQRKLELRESCDGYKDPVGVCQSEGVEMAIQLLEQALNGVNNDK